MAKLLLATSNRGKIREYRSLLNDLPFEMITPDDLGLHIKVNEDYPSYEENASTKARAYARASRLITLADDSGLEIDALGGEPGVHSARAAGETATDKNRIEHLLGRLKDVPWDRRTACFKCIIAIAVTEEIIDLCYGECQGFIALEPGGELGFGYDPVFYLPEFAKTMAELPLEIKNQVSHRGKAAREAYRVLEKIAGEIKL
jgi:XTP/dITP diphosphohydrolase